MNIDINDRFEILSSQFKLLRREVDKL